MRKRVAYTDEPIKIGRQVGLDVLPGHGGPRTGAGRPPAGNKAVTLRLPVKLVERVRRDAKASGQTISQYVASRLRVG
jgi:hypothetical protein